jgi:hypothetical protein
MKSKYRYFINRTLRQAIKFNGSIGYWRHLGNEKGIASILSLDFIASYHENVEVKRKEFFNYIKEISLKTN